MFDHEAMRGPAHQARYTIEHRLMPSLFYENSERVFIGHGPGLFAFLHQKVAEDTPAYECPYTEDDFSEEVRRYDNGGRIVIIQRVAMPAAQIMPDCHAVYLCYEKNGARYYFTSECSIGGTVYLCAWTPDGTHQNFGVFDGSFDEFDRIAELYWSLK